MIRLIQSFPYHWALELFCQWREMCFYPDNEAKVEKKPDSNSGSKETSTKIIINTSDSWNEDEGLHEEEKPCWKLNDVCHCMLGLPSEEEENNKGMKPQSHIFLVCHESHLDHLIFDPEEKIPLGWGKLESFFFLPMTLKASVIDRNLINHIRNQECQHWQNQQPKPFWSPQQWMCCKIQSKWEKT